MKQGCIGLAPISIFGPLWPSRPHDISSRSLLPYDEEWLNLCALEEVFDFETHDFPLLSELHDIFDEARWAPEGAFFYGMDLEPFPPEHLRWPFHPEPQAFYLARNIEGSHDELHNLPTKIQ